MSVVTCRIKGDKIEFAADSAITSGDMQNTKETTFVKLIQVKDIVLGAVGKCDEAAMFCVFLRTHCPKSGEVGSILELLVEFASWKKEKQGEHKIENSYIYGVAGRAFRSVGFFVDEVKTHIAIGSGREYAYAALDMGFSPAEAVKTACKYNIYCSEPIIEIKMSKEK